MRVKGKITSWNDEKGFGFITPLAGGKRIFIHMTAFSNRGRRPELNEVVTYSVSSDGQGRPCAVNATLAGDKLTRKEAKKSNKAAIAIAALFIAAIGISALTGYLSTYVLIGYAALSLVTFIAYALDKSAAQRSANVDISVDLK